ncbi:uncharacterized protein CC84DRAFT_1164742 [Paraphaeosphaeria sporulosa]|uniref:DUF6594 domain-containing protein n=1 Tax=Paraphaeosphaeria sporulosa TaxID=1460663 RepID=A0A177CHZ5_9PLEO|nr:uncharacterized protein CC84DRAFT_1164742 [Paraphaeosphaeria sporulosa]OAG06479.1 hypothetical protein CC84DRAFT_1164742 [Paraphaeosphaeria sporulosa]
MVSEYVHRQMSLELQEMDSRPSTSDRAPSTPGTATAINTPDQDQFPQHATQPDTVSLSSDLESISSDSENEGDEDGIRTVKGKLPDDAVEGWPQLAQLMADQPEFAAFPRFRDLNVKSLLYYQVELNSLRKKLHRLEHADKAHPRNQDYSLYADTLVNESNASEQLKTMKTIRGVLKEYNEALLQYSKVCALPDPEPFNMRTLRGWLRHEHGGNLNVQDLDDGGPVNTWGLLKNNPDDEEKSLGSQFRSLLCSLLWMRRPEKSMHEPDLALTAPQIQVDGLTHWYASELIPFRRSLSSWKERKKMNVTPDLENTASQDTGQDYRVQTTPPWPKKTKKEDTLVSWSENSALRLTSGISTVVACLLPVIAISVLSQLQGLKALLICLAGFSLVFAIGLIALTQGTSKRTEIFGATAAFSAVMVVFISIPPAPVIMMPPGSAIPSVSPSAVISALPTG